MLTARTTSTAQASAARPSARPAVSGRRCSVSVHASKEQIVEISRRQVVGILGVAVAGFASTLAAPAQAGLFDDTEQVQAEYATRTASILTNVKATLDLPKDDPTKEDKVKELRKEINTWVAAYRREPRVSGRPSFGNTYSVLNALAGHYNSFGATAPIPKKRLERVLKELDDADRFLSRGR